MQKVLYQILSIAFLSMALTVGLGAFGAHLLEAALHPDDYKVYQTGVLYQFIHTLGILILISFSKKLRTSQLRNASILFFLGIIFFSFSLYILEITLATTGIRYSWLGAITPVGGVFFIAGWLYLTVVTLKKSAKTYESSEK